MKTHLMYLEQDFDLSRPGPPQQAAVVQDLELATLIAAMANGDRDLASIAQKVVLAITTDVATILYRQNILRDCLRNESIIRAAYELTIETLIAERKNYLGITTHYPQWILHRSVEVMEMLVSKLQRLRDIADQHAGRFTSEGFGVMFTMLQRELDDDYFALVRRHLKQLKFQRGTLLSARLGEGNRGADYALRAENAPEGTRLQRILSSGPPSHSFTLPERDESGARALSELRDRGINLVANAVAQSVDHIVSFFKMLSIELGFYVCCLNLHAALAHRGEPVCFPIPSPAGYRGRKATGLYDVCLALTTDRKVVGNDLQADSKNLCIITGANQGGKSTFLRSVGVAQMMMQCGMFVPAQEFAANVSEGIFTHYKREEDTAMESGKLDEELRRMSAVADHLVPDALMLFNESFAATNEREGSEIARQIVAALTERGVEVFFVSHQYEFAQGFHAQHRPDVLFLRAERQPDGGRTFKLVEAAPLPTSFGQDLYRRIFDTAAASA